jgi:hypothetical protein
MATLTEEGAPVVNVHTAGGRFDEPHGQDFKQFADVLAQRLNDTVRALFDEIERAGDSDYDGLRLH